MATALDPTATDTASSATTKKRKAFNTLTTATLAKIDPTKLEGDELGEYASAAADRLNDLTSSVYVDKRTGCVYRGDKLIGNVLRPIKASTVIPSALRAKDEHVSGEGSVNMPTDSIRKGFETLDIYLTAACRFTMARMTGNGVNLIGQKSKDDTGAANALASVKSAMA